MHGAKKALGMIQACLAGLMYAPFFSKIEIFLLALANSFSMIWLSKHASLSFSHLITHHLFTFLQADPMHKVHIMRFSAKWSGLSGKLTLDTLTMQAQNLIHPVPPPSLSSCKPQAFCNNYSHWEEMPKGPEFTSRIPPPSLTHHKTIPIIRSILYQCCKQG
jgi:hypothetical protein